MCVECLIGKQKKQILFKVTVAVLLFDRDSVAGDWPALSSRKSMGRHCADNNAGAQRYLFSGRFQISGDRGTQSPGGGTRWVAPLD